MEMLIDFFKKIFGLDKLDYRIRRLERAKYWKEKYEKIKNELFASVKFVSEVISVKKDKENKVIEGNPDKIKLVTDYWKFSKNILKKGPNWYLCEIISK